MPAAAQAEAEAGAVGGEEAVEEAAAVVGGVEAEALEGEEARAVGGAPEGREAAGKVEVALAAGGAPVGRETAGQVAVRLRLRVPPSWAATLRAPRHRKETTGPDREERTPQVSRMAAASGLRPVPPLALRPQRSCGADCVPGPLGGCRLGVRQEKRSSCSL